jgi:predicted CopG family antitoxin
MPNISAYVDDEVYHALKEYKKKDDRNISNLVNRLLKAFFFGNHNHQNGLSKEILRIIELERQHQELQKIAQESLKELEELKKTVHEKQEIKELENQTELIRKMEVWFENIEIIDKITGEPNKDLIERNLELFAQKHQISLKEAEELFFKVFPEIKEELEDLL